MKRILAFPGETIHLLLIVMGILCWTYYAHAADTPEGCKYRLVRYQKAGAISWGMDIEFNSSIPSQVIRLDSEVGLDIDSDADKIFSKATWKRLCSAAIVARKSPGVFADQTVQLSPKDILPPLPQPKNIVATGMNYQDHQDEVDKDDTVYFSKNVKISSPYADIVRPNGALLDWEVELAAVVRKKITPETKLSAVNIAEYIAGFVLANDVTNRIPIIADTDKGFTKGKTEETFLPVGPYFLPIEFFAPHDQAKPNLKMKMFVNGEVRQNSFSSHMLNDLIRIVQESLRQRDVLWVNAKGKEGKLLSGGAFEPGDLILTGTPAGTAIQAPDLGDKLGLALRGAAAIMNPRDVFKQEEYCSGKYLRSGDTVAAEIQYLGKQENTIRENYKNELAVDCRANGRKISRMFR